jgi:carbamoyl-phosphate synthase large subunit
VPSPDLSGPQGRRLRVLVTGAGGAAAVAFLRDLEDRVDLIAADLDPYAAGLYLVPPTRRELLPRGDAAEFTTALLAACVRHKVDVLVPTVDVELAPISRRVADFAQHGVRVLVESPATLARTLDKATLVRVCAGAVRVPHTRVLDHGLDDGALAAAGLTGAVVVKPRRGAGGRGVAQVTAPAGLADLPRDGSMIVQELLPGAEWSLDVLAGPGRVVAVVPRRRDKVDSGIAVAARTVSDPALEDFGKRVARAVGLRWVANVQCRADSAGRPALLEVNPRFPGTMPLTVQAGVDLPAWALHDLLGRPLPTSLAYRDIAVVRYWAERYVPVSEVDDLLRRGEQRVAVPA